MKRQIDPTCRYGQRPLHAAEQRLYQHSLGLFRYIEAANGLYVAIQPQGQSSFAELFVLHFSLSAPDGDTTPPAVSIASPADGAAVSGTVNLIANATDKVGASKVWFLTDGVVGPTDTTAPCSYSWNTTAVSNRRHTAPARAFDAAGIRPFTL